MGLRSVNGHVRRHGISTATAPPWGGDGRDRAGRGPGENTARQRAAGRVFRFRFFSEGMMKMSHPNPTGLRSTGVSATGSRGARETRRPTRARPLEPRARRHRLACSRPGLASTLAALVAGVILLGHGAALPAQIPSPGGALPSELVTAEELDALEHEQIEAHVGDRLERLLAGEAPDAAARARRELAEPLRHPTGPSVAFVEVYCAAMVPGIERALESEVLLVRLNAAILFDALPPEDALTLIPLAIADASPAVRYRALRSVERVARRHGWSSEQERALLEPLAEALEQPQPTLLAEKAMRAMVALEVPDAVEAALESLNRRGQAHEQSPGQGLAAEHAGLEAVFRRVLGDDEADAAHAELRRMARTAYGYLHLAAAALQGEAVAEAETDGHRSMIRLADRVLRESHSALDAAPPPPEPVDYAVSQGDWSGVLARAEQWQAILTEAPFGFSAGDLVLAEEQ